MKPVEGNSYPLGALPTGTMVCQVQKLPGSSEVMVKEFLLLLSKTDLKKKTFQIVNAKDVGLKNGPKRIPW